MASLDQVKISRRQVNLNTVVFSAEQEVTVPASIKISQDTQYLLQPVLLLAKDKLTVTYGAGKVRVLGQLEGIFSCVDNYDEVSTLAVPPMEFVAAFTTPALGPDADFKVDVHLDGIEVDQGEGVANITAYLIINLWATQAREVELVSSASGGELVAKADSVRLQPVLKETGGQKSLILRLPCPPEALPVGTEVCLGSLSWQVSEGKLAVSGQVLARVYCLFGEGRTALLEGEQALALELDFEDPGVAESALSSSVVKAGLNRVEGEEALDLELVFKVNATGYREQTMEYVSGLTGADSMLRTVRLMNRLGEGEFKIALEGNCPFATPPENVDLVLPKVRIIEAQALEGKVLVRGLLTLYVYYSVENDKRRVLVQEEEFSQLFDMEGCARGYTLKAWAWPGAASCREGRYTVPVLIRAEVTEEVEFTAVTDIHVVDYTQGPIKASVVLYTIKKGDSIFSLARKFNTTQELLWEHNGFKEGEGLEPGQKILIPVYQSRQKK